MEKVAIIVVTYKRQALLDHLFASFLSLEDAPWRIVVVDNEHSKKTAELIARYQCQIENGKTACAWPEGTDAIVYVPMMENTGGAGGFSEGVRVAYEMGASWFWLMDDDVEVMPDALAKLSKWSDSHGVVQGSRLDYDGGPFYWQYRFSTFFAIYNPFATAKFDQSGSKQTNTACFEGGLFSREIVRKIGYPDERYFIYWDDCTYGYLASKVTDSVVVSDVVLRRTREVKNWEVTGVRQLNSSSDMTRYYIMRNRGHMAHYLQMHGDYHRIGYALGTVLSFAKEIIRLVMVDRSALKTGSKRLWAGWKASRVILHDASWKPAEGPFDE